MTFKNHYELLNEGYLQIPQRVFKDILSYYTKLVEKSTLEKHTQAKKTIFPPKTFPLDFSGTSFEFLNDLNPKPTVTVQFTLAEWDPWMMEYDKKQNINTIIKNNSCTIQLGLKNFKESWVWVTEHEILHVAQYLTKKYKVIKILEKEAGVDFKKIDVSDKFFYDAVLSMSSDVTIGGLPNKKDIQHLLKLVDVEGKWRDDPTSMAAHGHRPVELFPNLLMLVRKIQQAYLARLKSGRHYEKDTYTNRDNFFREVYKEYLDIASQDSYFLQANNKTFETNNVIIPIKTFNDAKTVSPDYYKKFLNTVYNGFVNGDAYNFDIDYIEAKEKELKTLRNKVKKTERKNRLDYIKSKYKK